MLLTSDFVTSRYEELRARVPTLQIITELGTEPDPDVTALFSFKLPSGIAPRLPNLRLAASVGLVRMEYLQRRIFRRMSELLE